MINILLSTDANYIMPTGVLMTSISTNNKNVNYHILIEDSVIENDLQKLRQTAQQHNHSVHFYRIDKKLTRNLPFGRENQAHHVSIATYFRLFVTELLPQDMHKILYLDGDMIVRKNLTPLWETDLRDVAVACVHDMDEHAHIQSQRLPYPMNTGYFNAGMLLINLDYWREHNASDIFMTFIAEHAETLQLHDQDVLNSVLWDKRHWLHATYNFQSGFIYLPQYMNNHSNIEKEIEEAKGCPAIVHFCAPEKPWMLECFNPYCKEWRKYWRKSIWHDQPLQGERTDTLKNRIRSFALRHNLYTPPNGYQKIKVCK